MNASQLIQDLENRGIIIGLEGESVTLRPESAVTPDLLEIVRAKKAEIIAVLSIARLPWQLERLVKAAVNGALKEVNVRGVVDTKICVTAYALEYFIGGDREECLRRLWEVHSAWQATKN